MPRIPKNVLLEQNDYNNTHVYEVVDRSTKFIGVTSYAQQIQSGGSV